MRLAFVVAVKQDNCQEQSSTENPAKIYRLLFGHRQTAGTVPRISNRFLRFLLGSAFEDLTIVSTDDILAACACIVRT
jgi:hypothetical protein